MNRKDQALYCAVSILSNMLADMGDYWNTKDKIPMTPVKKALAIKITSNKILNSFEPGEDKLRAMINMSNAFSKKFHDVYHDGRTAFSVALAMLERVGDMRGWCEDLTTLHKQVVSFENYYSYRRKTNVESYRAAEPYVKIWESLTR